MANVVVDFAAASTSDQSDAIKVFGERLEQAFQALIAAPGNRDLPHLLAEALKADPRAAEIKLRDASLALCCGILGKACERLDDHGPSVVVGGVSYWRAPETAARMMSLFGPVSFRRSRYRPSGGGEAVFPTEAVLGAAEGGMTAAAAEMSLYLMSCLTARESEEIWRRMAGRGPSASSLARPAAAEGRRWREIEAEALAAMRQRETVPDRAGAVQVMLDGVMMRMRPAGRRRRPGWCSWPARMPATSCRAAASGGFRRPASRA